MLGTMFHLLGDSTQAIGFYEHAARLGPSAHTFSNLAFYYDEAGRYEEALKACQESLARDATFPMTHRNIGDVYMRLAQREKASAAYEAAIEAANKLLAVNPRDAVSIALVALCEARLGRRAAAERHAAEALSLRPKDREVVVKNAEVYAILNRPEQALRYLSTAMTLGYGAAQARQNDELASLRPLPEFATTLKSASWRQGRCRLRASVAHGCDTPPADPRPDN